MVVYEFSVLMALVDFIPVILFGISAVLMQRDLYSKMPKYAFACLAAGSIDAFLAGFLKALIPVFVLCFFCYMAMGYLTSRDGGSAAMNWAEQGVNCLGQALLLGGVYVLHRAGLREYKLL